MNQDSNKFPIFSVKSIFAKTQFLFQKLLSSDFFAKVAETFFTRIILMLLSLATGVIIARTLGPEGRGLFAMAMVLGTMGVQLTNMGLQSSNTLYVARDKNLLAPLLGNSLVISFGLGSLASGIALAVFLLFPQIAPVDGVLLVLGLIWIPFGLAYMLLQNLIMGLQDIRAYNKIELGAKVFNISTLGSIILLGWVSPITVFIAALLTIAFSFILAWKRLAKTLRQKALPSLAIFKQALPYGLKFYAGSLLWYLLLRIDLFMVNKIMGEKSAGLYDVAFNMSEIFFIFPNIIVIILFPKLCAIDNIKEKWTLARNVGLGLIILLVLMTIVSTVLAEFIIQLLFGEAFIASTPIFLLLMVCKIGILINSIFRLFVASIHVPLASVSFQAALVILNIGLNLFMIEEYGMAGAAISSIICFGILIPFNIYYTLKYLRDPDTAMP